jgi:hypothetical protein
LLIFLKSLLSLLHCSFTAIWGCITVMNLSSYRG